MKEFRVVGEKRQGKRRGEIGWHGHRPAVVSLSDRKLRIWRPRIRRDSTFISKKSIFSRQQRFSPT